MPTYTVTAVQGSTPKQYNGKDMQEISFTLSDGAMSESCTWFTRGDTQVPTIGSTIDGEIDRSNPQYPPKFKKAFTGGGGGWKGGGNMSPEREKKIVRQHSQATAIAYLEAQGMTLNSIEELKPIIDWFDRDVFGAEAAPQPLPTLNDILVTPEPEKIPF